MDGTTTILIVLAVAGEQLGRRFVHPYFGAAYLPMLLAAYLVYLRLADRGRRRRLAAITALPEDQRRAAADALDDDDERSVARIALGLVDPVIDGPQPTSEEVFSYPGSWKRSVAWTYWGCLALMAVIVSIGYAQHVATRDDFPAWLGLMVGFGAGAAFLRWYEPQLYASIFVNVSGIGVIDAGGRRRIILWSQLSSVRPRPLLMQVDFHGGAGTRKIVVPYFVERFARLMEIVGARLQELKARTKSARLTPEALQTLRRECFDAKRVPPDAGDGVHGIIVDAPQPGGLDTLAAYSNGSVRFIHHAGGAIFWDPGPESGNPLRPLVDALLGAAAAMPRSSQAASWTVPARPLDNFQATLLTGDGVVPAEMADTELTARLSQASVALVQAVIAQVQ
jgi:hypothetical protein